MERSVNRRLQPRPHKRGHPVYPDRLSPLGGEGVGRVSLQCQICCRRDGKSHDRYDNQPALACHRCPVRAGRLTPTGPIAPARPNCGWSAVAARPHRACVFHRCVHHVRRAKRGAGGHRLWRRSINSARRRRSSRQNIAQAAGSSGCRAVRRSAAGDADDQRRQHKRGDDHLDQPQKQVGHERNIARDCRRRVRIRKGLVAEIADCPARAKAAA